MPKDPWIAIGVATASGRKPFTYAALDSDLRQLAIGAGSAVDVLSFALGQTRAVLALSAPLRPHLGHRANPESGLVNLGSYLRQMELELTREPDQLLPPPAGLPSWLHSAYGLAEQLESLGYIPYPHETADRIWLETQSQAALHSMLGIEPFDGASIEGRIQRQLVLRDFGLDLPDAMDFYEEITRYRLLHGVLHTEMVLPLDELNALAAALTAHLAAHEPDRLIGVGHSDEGCIYLPQKEIEKAR